MKKMFFFLIGAVLLFAGCTASTLRNNTSEGTIVLSLSEKDVSNQTIVPGINMDIAAYDIYGSGPGDSFQQLDWTGGTLEVISLIQGAWIINVDAKNSTGTIIANGSESTTVVGGSITPVTVTVTPLDGNGDLEVNVSWQSGEISSPSISGSVEDSALVSTTLSTFSYTAIQGSSTTELEKSYYALFLTINDGATPLFDGLVDIVRIVYNETTIANLTVEGIGEDTGVSITIEDALDPPIEINFSGQQSAIDEGTDMTVTATTDPSPVDLYQWYLNGQKLTGETNPFITIGSSLPVKNGYKLTLMVTMGTILSSENIYFDVGSVDLDLLADFNANNGSDINNWNGPMGPMPDDTIAHSYDDTVFHGASGKSLKLDYDVSTIDSWNGFWIKLAAQTGDPLNPDDTPVDISGYEYLSFWIRGAVGGTEHLKIAMANDSSNADRKSAFLYVTDYLDGGITNVWQEVKIPLDAFANLDGVTNVNEIAFVFENAYATTAGFATSGIVNIDDMKFFSTSLGYVKVDHFGDNYGWLALGGNMGSMGVATNTFDSTEYHNFPYSLKSTYDVNPPNQDWAGQFMLFGGGADGNEAQNCDFSDYTNLTLWVKANSDTENPENIKLEIVYGTASTVNVVLSGITTSWQQYTINLTDEGIDKTSIKQINIIYEMWRAADDAGILFFDEIQFE